MTGYPRYSVLQRLIHWAVAICVLFVLPMGLTLGVLGFDGVKNTFGMDATNFIYKYHKTFGVIILGLMILRLVASIPKVFLTPISELGEAMRPLVRTMRFKDGDMLCMCDMRMSDAA